ncbi:Inositolphosphorylceramide synthase subunit Kei1-domain-containing protein, partial [Sparassis latifolia]
MKLTLRPEWRLRPLTSFLGVLDLKTGVTIALLFAVLNKVAGVYGLVAVLTGAGGSAAQLSLYIYSVIGLTALIWGLKAITKEDPKHSLYFAHLFFADHVVSTAWLVFFAVLWWVYTPHDGRRQANSDAQREMMNSGAPVGGSRNMTELERVDAAMAIWDEEKGRATAVIVLGWLAKFYFAALLYSYAILLRKGTYRSLSHSRPVIAGTLAAIGSLPDEEDEEIEDFYRLPVRMPQHSPLPSLSQPSAPGASISSYGDFISAPPVGRRTRPAPGKSSLSVSHSAVKGAGADAADDVDEVLFDED